MNLLRIATGDPDINDKLVQISGTTKVDDDKVSQSHIFLAVCHNRFEMKMVNGG